MSASYQPSKPAVPFSVPVSKPKASKVLTSKQDKGPRPPPLTQVAGRSHGGRK